MAVYLRFTPGDGETKDVLVEVDAAGSAPVSGEEDAGLSGRALHQVGTAVTVVQSGFEEAVRRAVGVNARAFLTAAEALEKPPDEMEVTFGLKVTGELGNLAVGKVAGESNYEIRMVWRRPSADKLPPGGDAPT